MVLELVVNGRGAVPSDSHIRFATERFFLMASEKIGASVRVADMGFDRNGRTLRKSLHPVFTAKIDRRAGTGLAQVCTFVRLVGVEVNTGGDEGIGTTIV